MKFQVADSVRRKLKIKHNVEVYEVEEVLEDKDKIKRRSGGSKRLREIKYRFVGRTRSGRLLQVYLVIKPGSVWLASAYDGDREAQKLYNLGQ